MGIDAIITLIVILGAVILFATEVISIDLVAILIMITLILSGVISPEEGISGFSNSATITVAFMFALSAALLKTGALQVVAFRLSQVFKENFRMGMVLMMILIAVISAFVNNTPVVAVFIPVIIQIAHNSGISATKMLIPLSFASIFGGTCTLIGTSTNILVSGIAEKAGLEPFSMFLLAPVGLVFVVVGTLYMTFIGNRLLPDRKEETDLKKKFGMRDYLTEIELMENSEFAGQRIMDSALVKDLEMDVMEVRRKNSRFTLPPGDFVLREHDVLQIRCNVEKIKALKDRARIDVDVQFKIGEEDLRGKHSTLVELIITADSEFEGKTLKELDFRRRFRAIPLAIRHRNEILHEHLYKVPIRAGDVILAEAKTHYLKELNRLENETDAPFALLSEDHLTDFNKRRFGVVVAVIFGVVMTATFNILPILVSTILGVSILVLLRSLSMKELYEAINWKVIFLLAGALSLGVAMQNSGLDKYIAGTLVERLGVWGPAAIISGLYLTTSLLTELMSNNATAALMAPIAIATAIQLDHNPVPYLVAITFAASASFMTPVGYQTNTMVFSAGQYRFLDFFKTGAGLSLIFWILASIMIPLVYGL
jgi:di/tricarboxylate transporter